MCARAYIDLNGPRPPASIHVANATEFAFDFSSDECIERDPLSPIGQPGEPFDEEGGAYGRPSLFEGIFADRSDAAANSVDTLDEGYADVGASGFPEHHGPAHHHAEGEQPLAATIDGPPAKKHTFNPLSKPFEPARKSLITSDYCSATESSSSSQSPEPLSDCCAPIEPCVGGAHADAEQSDDAKSADAPEFANENLKHVFQRFFDAHSTQATHTDRRFLCILCSAHFRTVHALRKHLLDKVDKAHECIVCGRAYANKFVMQRHRSSHRNQKSFSCRGCYKRCRNVAQLDKHFDACRFKLYIHA